MSAAGAGSAASVALRSPSRVLLAALGAKVARAIARLGAPQQVPAQVAEVHLRAGVRPAPPCVGLGLELRSCHHAVLMHCSAS